MQHLIKKQRINITLSKQADAFRLQQQVNDHYKQDVLPLLEDVFDELSDEEEVLQIEQLVIDLGVLSEREIKAVHWNDSILTKIKEQLYEKIGQKGRSMSGKQEPITFSVCKQWLFYMQKGYLPWNAFNVNEAWYNKVLEALAVDFASVAELRKIISENSVVSKRIIEQHDESFLIKLIEILSTENQRDLAAMIETLIKLILSRAQGSNLEARQGRQGLKEKIWEQVIQLAALEERKPTTEGLIEKALLQYMSYQDVGTIINSGNFSLYIILMPVLKKIHEKPELFSENEQSVIKGKQKEKMRDDEIKSDSEIDEEGIFVQYAGMVLIHPFLSSLFKRLQLVNGGKFIDSFAQQKAIALLHYVAMGETAPQEHELVMPKILCEWPLQMPVDKNIVLNEGELNEADTMLQAAIEQWTVLKNTSIGGLREGFLHRAGKLFTKNDNLHLQVETNSIDVLLDQLPWNLSMIKLPWMKKILRVEWR